MTNLADFLLDNATNVEQVTHTLTMPKGKHPSGWEPSVTWSGEDGIGVSKPRPYDGLEVDHASLLTEWGFDPEQYEIDGALEFRQWDAAVGLGATQAMRYYKARIVRRSHTAMTSLPDLINDIKKHKKAKKSAPVGERAFVVALADWQLGGTDMHGSSADTVARIMAMIDGVTDRIQDLRKTGRDLGTLYVFGLGDIIEGTCGFYANQEFSVDLTREEQIELGVRLLLKALRAWAPLFERVVVGAVVGNHGEARQGGKPNTDRIRDNADTSVFKTAALVLAENPTIYGHVSFVIPKDRSTLCLDVAGVGVGIVHGNQYSSAQGAVQKYWANQTLGLQPIADAQILLSGHYHHLKVDQYGPRTHIQVPAMDNGSRWFTESSGMDSPGGTVTFVVGASGWSDLQVIS